METVGLGESLVVELWRSHELTLLQAHCLTMVQEAPKQPGTLARRLHLSQTSVTRVLERIEDRGLVKRVMDLHDRRRIWVELTDQGRTVLEELHAWRSSPVFTAIRSMDDVALERLTTALNDLADRVHRISPTKRTVSPLKTPN
ncbi:MAG: MarR family transcriptional regulator [Sulfobacillus benefaciens]|uniref:MarR family transcriptional regulator n=1 Tax=Sulfobacillus benefaciens TaxID=453960 RepID=A0A2T2WV57_9FIRM|nr:MAG: MarR family transcriptional regulator [Sulfobacillus benefaciens]HBQ94473.1 MarR family transcriptional regulator [Sulfobacillus sp.]